MKYLVPLVLIVLANVSFADNCDNPRDDFDGLYCLNKIYQESDKELNDAYKELRNYLTKKQKGILKKIQLKWIKQRNSSCSFKRDGQFFVSLGCTTKTTIEGTNQIRDRIRECKATGCQESKL
ncbi:hypothetical protein C2W62_03260 [Candidatus Entotheonella serta]|nr:hypothetical protein C2W62_03260 [Candidatus Entotheonella serta]